MGLTTRLKSDFVAGLLLVAPLAVTVFVLQFVFTKLAALLAPVVREAGLVQYTGNVQFAAQLLAIVLVVLFITLLGLLADLSIGRRLFGGFDRLVGLIPMVSVIYSSVRQVGNALRNRQNRYESVVLVEFPRVGVYQLGFVTGDSPAPAQTIADQAVYNVFIPNSPNPTAGNLVLVPEERVFETDLSVRRGLRLVVTTGITGDEDEFEEFAASPDRVPTVT